MSTALIISNETKLPVYSITPAAIQAREDALSTAALVGRVENADQNEKAVKAQIGLKLLAAQAESVRKKLKEPILQAGRDLDRAVAEYLTEVNKELGRLSNLTSQFQLAEQRRVREEEELQRRELERIEQQKQAELRRIQEEQWRKEREAREAAEAAERAAKDAKNKKEREEAARLAAEAEARQKQAAQAAAEAAQKAQYIEERAAEARAIESKPIEAMRAGEQRVTVDWDIQVLNPYDLAKFHPDCVKIEPLLTPIKAKLNEGLTVKGIRAEKVTKADVRAGRPRLVDV